jgi:DNA-binding MurR/RpiR family transcriptional regulator
MFNKKDFFDNIQEKISILSFSKRKVANYVVNNYQKTAFMTAKKIAEKSGTSESTVNRFSKDMGYPGFPPFSTNLKNIVHAELSGTDRLKLINSDWGKSKIDYLNYLIEDEIRNLSKLFLIDKKDFDLFISMIVEANNVLLVGSRCSSVIVHYLYYGLGKIKGGVYHIDHIDSIAYDYLELLEDNTLIFAIGLGRYPKEVIEYLELAKAKNTKIISITDIPISPLVKNSEISLIAPVEIESYLGTISAPSCLVAAIVSGVSLMTKSTSIKRLNKLEEIARKKNYYV